MAWIRGQEESPTVRRGPADSASRRFRALVVRLLFGALTVLLRGVPGAALVCPGHLACTVRRLEYSLAKLPNPPGPPSGHPERLVAPVVLSLDEFLWLAELRGVAG
jgi:hypothetical protein